MSGSSKVRRPATLASLAAELGVSRTTVSNAYNRPDQLSAPLRERVLEAARRLGYPGPDPVARSLRTRRAGAVGLLLTEALSYAFRDPVATGFLEGLALACEQAGQGLLLVPVSPGARGRRRGAPRERRRLRRLLRPRGRPALPRRAGTAGAHGGLRPAGGGRGRRPGRRGRPERDAGPGPAPHRPGAPARRRDLHAARRPAQRRPGVGRPPGHHRLPRAAQPARGAARRPGRGGRRLVRRAGVGAVRPLGGGGAGGCGGAARGAPRSDGHRLHLGHPGPRRAAPRDAARDRRCPTS